MNHMYVAQAMLDQCLSDKGSGDRCLICPLGTDTYCQPAMEKIERLARHLRSRDYRLTEVDRQTILRETLYGIIQAVERKRGKGEEIDNVVALIGYIFRNKRAELYASLPRFGEMSTIRLPNLPDGLELLLAQFSGNLTLDGFCLSCTPSMPPKLFKQLVELSTDRGWCKAINQLYRNSWKGQLVDIDTLAHRLTIADRTGTKKEDSSIWKTLRTYCRFWDAINTRQSLACSQIFQEYGEKLMSDSNSERISIAERLGLKINTLNKRISRCYRLLHEFFIQCFREMGDGSGKCCEDLFTDLYGMDKAKRKGIMQRIEQTAQKRGITTDEVNGLIRRCRKLLLSNIRLDPK